MEWLNYHHLLYFRAVAEEGGIAAASRRLGVGRPSISVQLKSLEAFVGAPLFARRGRHLELTETGRLVRGYADEIFRTGRELVDAVRGRAGGDPPPLRVGIADAVDKLAALELLQPAVADDPPARLVCSEGRPERLFAELAVHELDLVLSDVPLPPHLDVRARSHVVGRSTTTLFAAGALHRQLARGFPRSLDGAPLLVPGRGTATRAALEAWLDEHGLRPRVVAELQDSALLEAFGQAGHGVFPAPTLVGERLERGSGVRGLGELAGLEERYFAVVPERRVAHDGVARILARARSGAGTRS